MKRKMMVALGLLVLLLGAPDLIGAQAPMPQAERVSLEALTGKTGWIGLGDLTPDRKHWATGGDPSVDFMTGPYEILNRRVDRRNPVLPTVGDRIRLTARNAVLILDYATTGEARALEAPSSVTRPKGAQDRTGIFLEVGTVVEVRAVGVSRVIGQARIAWARISPVTP